MMQARDLFIPVAHVYLWKGSTNSMKLFSDLHMYCGSYLHIYTIIVRRKETFKNSQKF